MSAKTSSPSAQLLRNSRFFSLPRPLPLPSADLLGQIPSERRPDNATHPYPIQQALVTTPKAQARGDWGLKRNLPLRTTTRSSAPVLRLNALDTREQITDFAPASDLTMSLKKIHEMSLSVTAAAPRTRRSQKIQRTSIFDAVADNTDPTQDVPGLPRWKYKGPWVAGMTKGDFDEYINKELPARKDEFLIYLKAHARRQLKNQRTMSNRQRRSNENDEAEGALYEPTEDEIKDYIRKLRNDFTLISELSHVVERFLDLPTGPMSQSSSSISALHYDESRSLYESGPPKTHPTAGITYLKSDAYLDNHPLFGPQKDRTPVEARILNRQQSGFNSRNASAGGKIGVAGIVSVEPTGREKIRSVPADTLLDNPYAVEDNRASSVGIGVQGGNRIWVQPTTMEVNSRGRLILKSSHSNSTVVGIKTGQLDASASIPAQLRVDSRQTPTYDSMPNFESSSSRRGGSSSGIKSRDGTSDLVASLRKDLNRRNG